jgi:multimeric flavodoxin WrbA
MSSKSNRRRFLRTAGMGVAAAAAVGAPVAALSAESKAAGKTLKIIGISGSPRKGKTTAASIQVALEAAKAVAPERIEIELIELADLKLNGNLAAGIPLAAGEKDDFPEVAAKLTKPDVAGIIVGSPVYFGSMTSLCKAFLDRCIALRMRQFALSGKVGAAVAVGGVRNGGQELTLQTITAALMCQEMVVVGDGRPTCHWGATVWNSAKDDISQDEFGMSTLKNLGRRVAEVAIKETAGK